MPRAWKRSADKKTKGAPWHVTYWDAEQSRERTRKGYADKEMTLKFGRKLEEDSRARADGLIDADSDAARTAAASPLFDHIDAYIAHLESRGRSTRYISQVRSRLGRFVNSSGIERITEINADRVVDFIRGLRRDDSMSEYTLGEYVGNLKAFSKWAVTTKRLLNNPLKTVEKPRRAGAEKKYQRRAITPEEIGRLLYAAARRPLIDLKTIRTGPRKGQAVAKVQPHVLAQAEATGRERVLAYLLAIWTGLRRSELASLTWGDVVLDALPARIELRAANTKSKRADTIALHPQVAEHLRNHKPPTATDDQPVLNDVPSMKVLRKDLAFAGIEFETSRGRIDLHAMRTGLATMLASAGVSQRLTQQHMRHTDPRLTNCVYTDEKVLPVAGAIAELPPLPTSPDDAQQQAIPMRATGTANDHAGAQRYAQRDAGSGGHLGAESGTTEPTAARPDSAGIVRDNDDATTSEYAQDGRFEPVEAKNNAAANRLARGGRSLNPKRVRRFERPTFTLAT